MATDSATTARAQARAMTLTQKQLEWLAVVQAAGFSRAEAERLLFVAWLAYTGRLES